MKEIELTKGKLAIIDDIDFDMVSSFNWCTQERDGLFYACRGRNPKIYMHRLILGVTAKHLIVDHKDGNPLNNRRGNLRVCSHAENMLNRRKTVRMKPLTSIYKGVCKKPWGFQAAIQHNRKWIYIGSFKSEANAAIAYNQKATELFGEFARLNEIEP
jgi:hypothetical protein